MTKLHSRVLLPESQRGLDQFRMESAREIGITLKVGHNGDFTSRGNGNAGGQMIKEISGEFNQGLK